MLAGLKVLDLSRLLPGPYATLVLADLGATVDKVESPDGDSTRHAPPFKGETSALHLALNRNKRAVVLDLKSPKGLDALKRLVVHYDVLVEGFRPGVMERLGLGYEVAKALNPRLIYCSVTGYGATGPDRSKAGHDINYTARAGVVGYGGDARGAPSSLGVQVADIGGSLFSVIGILAAVYECQRTGQGRHVDVSMTESALAFLHMQLGARVALGEEGTPLQRGREALNGGLPGYGLYRTKDAKWLAVGALEPHFFQGVCEVLGHPEWLEDAFDFGYGSRATRLKLEAAFAEKTQAEWLERFRDRDVCVEPVLEGDDVLADPQLVARGIVGEGVTVEGDRFSALRTPVRAGVPLRPARDLGADTAEVLAEAGFSAAEIAELAR